MSTYFFIFYIRTKSNAKIGSTPASKPKNCRKVFVGNLAYTTCDDSLRKHFEKCGTLVYAAVAFDANGKSRGYRFNYLLVLFFRFGHVEFETTEAADAAVALGGSNIDGRGIRVDYSNDKTVNSKFGRFKRN